MSTWPVLVLGIYLGYLVYLSTWSTVLDPNPDVNHLLDRLIFPWTLNSSCYFILCLSSYKVHRLHYLSLDNHWMILVVMLQWPKLFTFYLCLPLIFFNLLWGLRHPYISLSVWLSGTPHATTSQPPEIPPATTHSHP